MARKVEVELADDIDDSKADETVTFGADGTNYEIDLNAKHAEELRASLAKFVSSARRVRHDGVTTTASRGRAVAPAHTDRAQNQAIRDWAKRKKINLADRGRIPANIVQQYQAEAGR
jgi:Lsr2